ncbi:MAG TPA: hypothetical protein VNH39_07830, partial [Steroidobacteraceae bacterium]|nr:hypothetical protein [Steroidobacteraceae bacterium]
MTPLIGRMDIWPLRLGFPDCLSLEQLAVLSRYHGARGQSRVSGTELMIIAILLAMGGTYLRRDSKTEHAAKSAASAAGEPGTA